MSLGEFGVIQRFFKQSVRNFPYINLGIDDDAALIEIPDAHELVVSIDTLVEGVHFPTATSPYDIGYKSLAVSLSDMAAMGATPIACLLSLTLPRVNEGWLSEFSRGFFDLAQKFLVPLIGGDTTQGPLTISTVVHGLVPKGQAILRSGAKVGDLIYVSGTLGDAGLALEIKSDDNLSQRLNRPHPRVIEGLALREIINSAIDISDGLVADLKKILAASNVGAKINVDKLPLSSFLLKYCEKEKAHQLALSSGDDYELCFTVSKEKQNQFEKKIANLDCDFTCIGEVFQMNDLNILDSENRPFHLKKEGYEHFK